MENQKILARISWVLVNLIGEGVKIEPELDLTQIGLDSMKTVELFTSLEEELEIQFDDEDLVMENFRTPTTIYNIVQKALGAEDEKHATG